MKQFVHIVKKKKKNNYSCPIRTILNIITNDYIIIYVIFIE